MSPVRVRSVTAAELERGLDPSAERSLERGEILLFPAGALPLPAPAELTFLRDELGARATLKNISYHPEGDYLSGVGGTSALKERVRGTLRNYGESVTRFLAPLCPSYATSWRAGKVNFRPFEEEGRKLSAHSSNERVHVDAFASGATHGGRTLRFFTNVNPACARVWKSAGTFEELFPEFAQRVGLASLGPHGLRERALDRALGAFVRLCARAGLPQASAIESSPYDRAMKRVHDALKDDAAFQADHARCSVFQFPPFSSWAVLTDGVSHAAVRGQHALVATWTVPLAACAEPERAPYHVMTRR
jgi:hypothetical protein